VINLAVESCLISELPTILTPSMIFIMDEDSLKELASESEAVQQARKKLQQEERILQEALKKCQTRVRNGTGR